MLTKEELRAFAPHAIDNYLDALIDASEAQTRAGLTTPLRMCHFLAQCAHETGGFSIVREATNWTGAQMCALWPSRFKTQYDPRIIACRGDPEALANLAYSKRSDLGNIEPDDGWHYRGGGMLQTTGRAAYHEAGTALGIDLEGHPDSIEDPIVSLNVALHYWNKHDLNPFADRNYGRAIGNAINRGNPYSKLDPIGVQARSQWFDRAWHMFFSSERLPSDGELALGAYGSHVLYVQESLRKLGYSVGGADGVYGPVLARAVVAFKLDVVREHIKFVMEPAEIVGPITADALQHAKPIRHSPERAQATVEDLAAKGSTEVQAGMQSSVAGQLMLYGSAAEGARKLGVLDQLSQQLHGISTLRETMASTVDAISWGLGHAWWAVAILTGVWVWTKGRQVIAARLEAHRSGWNLWR